LQRYKLWWERLIVVRRLPGLERLKYASDERGLDFENGEHFEIGIANFGIRIAKIIGIKTKLKK